MDIVSRLKQYMDYRRIAISQFADTCSIPRPTISQILNGRNKKISDELIGKIHSAYPDLSVLWLMFGEGDMVTPQNIKISEPQNAHEFSFDDIQSSEHEIFSPQQYLFEEDTKKDSEKIGTEFASPDTMNAQDQGAPQQNTNAIVSTLIEKNDSAKKITSIVVFYADNTFQTFNPSTI